MQLQELFPDEWQAVVDAIAHGEASVSIRVNEARGGKVPAGAVKVPWCGSALYLDGRKQFTCDVDFQSGRYYVQDASSMFIDQVIRSLISSPVRYLDLCAAPGGKTTIAISALPAGSLVVANEVVPKRAVVLRENVMKWGNPRCVVTSSAPRNFGRLTHFFDVVAVDAPCSGEGMMRKDSEAVAQWSPSLVRQCADLQRSIIDDVWASLKPGGLLIYSTCTYNREENEEIVAYIMEHYGAKSVEVQVDKNWGIIPAIGLNAHCYRFVPHCTRGEGLFMAVLQKQSATTVENRQEKRGVKERLGKAANSSLPHTVEGWLRHAHQFTLQEHNGVVNALPNDAVATVTLLYKQVHVIYAGIELCSLKGKNCVPGQALALSTEFNPEAFPACEMDYRQALAFLRGESLVIDAPRGYVRLTHRGDTIGFVKNLGNRANNLYPKAWRILSTHTPQDEPPRLIDAFSNI